MNEKTIKKACELLERTIKLNENAGPEFYYNFDFSGHTKQVDFVKRALPGYEPVIKVYSYLEQPDLSVSLEDIEELIAAEEKAQKEARENDLI